MYYNFLGPPCILWQSWYQILIWSVWACSHNPSTLHKDTYNLLEKPTCMPINTHTHTRLTALCPGLPRWAGTKKVKTNLDFTEARDSEWQWHQLGHMQICTSLQTNNHANTPPLSFLQAGCTSCRPTNSVKALKELQYAYKVVCKCWWRTVLAELECVIVWLTCGARYGIHDHVPHVRSQWTSEVFLEAWLGCVVESNHHVVNCPLSSRCVCQWNNQYPDSTSMIAKQITLKKENCFTQTLCI